MQLKPPNSEGFQPSDQTHSVAKHATRAELVVLGDRRSLWQGAECECVPPSDQDQSNREFIPIIQQLESYTTEHIIFIDNRPIHLVRFLPFYDDVSNQTLFTLQYLYLNEIDSISFQLTVTKNGYGYSSSGRKYEFKCIKKDEYYCICEKV